jgi:hypothetical protein
VSNTGRKKKLATFNCEQELWAGFIRRCEEKGTTATATLTKFIQLYLDGELDNRDAYLGKVSDKSADTLEERIKADVDEYLEKCLPSHIDKYLAANYLANKTRTNTNSTNSAKEREFWFIQERAKYLKVKLNTDQLFRIEMFAAEAYKERHGQPPSKKLFRGLQASIYPAADVDILDSLITGVVARG